MGPTSDLAGLLQALFGWIPEGCLIGLYNPDSVAEIEQHPGVQWLREPDFTPPVLPPDFDGAVYFPATPDYLAKLANFAEDHAEPEVAIHLVIVREGRALLEWFDIPERGPTLMGELPEASVCSLADALGCTYERGIGLDSSSPSPA